MQENKKLLQLNKTSPELSSPSNLEKPFTLKETQSFGGKRLIPGSM